MGKRDKISDDSFVVSIRICRVEWEKLGKITSNRSKFVREYISRTIQRKIGK